MCSQVLTHVTCQRWQGALKRHMNRRSSWKTRCLLASLQPLLILSPWMNIDLISKCVPFGGCSNLKLFEHTTAGHTRCLVYKSRCKIGETNSRQLGKHPSVT